MVDQPDSQGWTLVLGNGAQESLLIPNTVTGVPGNLRSVPHVKYDADVEIAELVGLVERDLRRIYSCKSLERLAAVYGEGSVDDHEIKLNMTKIDGDLASTSVKSGDTLRFEIVNEGANGCAYSVFFTTGRFKIKHEGSGFVQPRKSIFRPTKHHLFDVTINNRMIGRNGLVLVGIPQEGKVQHQLHLAGLAQPSLGVVSTKKRGFVPKTDFERQLHTAMFDNHKYRAGGTGRSSPQMSIISWVMSE